MDEDEDAGAEAETEELEREELGLAGVGEEPPGALRCKKPPE